jgi:hypothetical protein
MFKEYTKRKTIKISTWLDLHPRVQLDIISEYYWINDNDLSRMKTKKGTRTKMSCNGRNYHITCHETKTQIVFEIGNG